MLGSGYCYCVETYCQNHIPLVAHQADATALLKSGTACFFPDFGVVSVPAASLARMRMTASEKSPPPRQREQLAEPQSGERGGEKIAASWSYAAARTSAQISAVEKPL